MKNYVAPKSVVLSMNMNENIAASSGKQVINVVDNFYTVDGLIENIEGLEYKGEGGALALFFSFIGSLPPEKVGMYSDLLQKCQIIKQ